MGLLSRLAGAIKSNLNELIDGAQDPEQALDQIIVEMRGQLVEAKKQVAVAIADERRLKQQADNEQKSALEWERKAMLAVKAGDDELAKQALLRQREHDSLYEQLALQHGKQAHAVEQLKTALRALAAKIDEADRKKSVLVARKRRADAMRTIEDTLSGIKDSSAFDDFARLEKKIDQAEAEAEAQSELNRATSGATLKQRFDDLERDAGAAAALDALKQKMGLASPPPVAARVAPAPEDDADMAELEEALAELKAREAKG